MMSLELRKKVIEKEAANANIGAARDWAHGFRAHMMQLFKKSREFLGRALNWRTLDFGARKNVAKTLVRHALRFGGINPDDVDVSFKDNGAFDKNVLGTASGDGRRITLYSQLMQRNNLEEILNTCTHEATHIFQPLGKTTLSARTAKICMDYYVPPHESLMHYRNNPIEEEAREAGQGVSNGFYRDMQRLYRENSFARAA